MRDGVKLAFDIIRPAKDGHVESRPLPVIWELQRYHRAEVVEEHKKNVSSAEVIEKLAYRDSYDEVLGLWREGNPVYFLQSIKNYITGVN